MRKFLLTTAALAALASAGATAQTATTTTDSPANGNDKMNSSANQGAGAMGVNQTPRAPASEPQTATQDVPKEGPNFVQVQDSDMLSSNVVGLDIHNGQNDNIGKI